MIDTVFAIDVSDKNTYLIERINKHLDIYSDKPFFISCTDSPHIKDIVQADNVCLVPYSHKFSLAAQKNRAVAHSTAPYLLLSDPDFFSYSNIYDQIERLLKATKVINHPSFFFFPALYANEYWSNVIFNSSRYDIDRMITSFLMVGFNEKIKKNCHFIAPYSNTILISRDIFYYVGGYNENFDGFGSEDFEFLIRALIVLGIKPLPDKLNFDIYQPSTKHFLRSGKKFIGFRNLLSLYSASISNMGYTMVHLHHDKPSNEWYTKKDYKKVNFNRQIIPFLKDNTLILEMDWLNHEKKVICMITDIKKWRPFLVLRKKGYKTIRCIVEYIDIQNIKYLSDKHNTINIAFIKEFYNSNLEVMSKLNKDGYNIIEVDNEDILVKDVNIDKESYSFLQCGFSKYGINMYLYDLFYRIKIKFNTFFLLYGNNIK